MGTFPGSQRRERHSLALALLQREECQPCHILNTSTATRDSPILHMSPLHVLLQRGAKTSTPDPWEPPVHYFRLSFPSPPQGILGAAYPAPLLQPDCLLQCPAQISLDSLVPLAGRAKPTIIWRGCDPALDSSHLACLQVASLLHARSRAVPNY